MSKKQADPLVLVVSTSDRGEKITRPLSTTEIDFEYFQFSGPYEVVKFFRFVKKINPDLIISDSVALTGGAVMTASVFFSVPYVVRLRGDALLEQRILFQKYLSDHNLKKAFLQIPRQFLTIVSLWASEQCLPVSEFLRSRYNWAAAPSSVIHTPCFMLNNNHTEDNKETNRGSDYNKNIILSVTNMHFLDKISGLLDGLEPVAKVLDNQEDTTLLIAGDGPYREDVERKCAELSGDIRVLGYVEEIQYLYEIADVFIHFSYLDAYPSTVLEAYANRIPVIANNAVGMVEQIEDGDTGYLVDLDKPVRVEYKLNKLLESSELQENMGEAGYQYVKSQNTPLVVGDELESRLRQILN